MPTPSRQLRASLLPSAIAAMLALILAACDGGDGSSQASSLRCTPDESTCLGATNADGQPDLDVARTFSPSIATLRGDRVDVVLRGATPGETVQVFSTASLYDRVPQRADDDGEIAFTLEISEVRAHTFIVVSELAEDGEFPAMWRFAVVVAEPPELDPTVIDRAAELIALSP